MGFSIEYDNESKSIIIKNGDLELDYSLNKLIPEEYNIQKEVDKEKRFILDGVIKIDDANLEPVLNEAANVEGLLNDITKTIQKDGDKDKLETIEDFKKKHKQQLSGVHEELLKEKQTVYGGGKLAMLFALLHVCAVVSFQAISPRAILDAPKDFHATATKNYNRELIQENIQKLQNIRDNVGKKHEDYLKSIPDGNKRSIKTLHNLEEAVAKAEIELVVAKMKESGFSRDIQEQHELSPLSDEYRLFTRNFLKVFLNTNGQCAYNSEFLIGNNHKYVAENLIGKIEEAIKNKDTNPIFGDNLGLSQIEYSTVKISTDKVLDVTRTAGQTIYESFLSIKRENDKKEGKSDIYIKEEDIIVGFSFGYKPEKSGHGVTAYVRKIGGVYKIAMADMNNVANLVYASTDIIDKTKQKLFVVENGFFDESEMENNTSGFIEVVDDPVLTTIHNTYTTIGGPKLISDTTYKPQDIRIMFETPSKILRTSNGGISATLPIFDIISTSFQKMLELKEKLYDLNEKIYHKVMYQYYIPRTGIPNRRIEELNLEEIRKKEREKIINEKVDDTDYWIGGMISKKTKTKRRHQKTKTKRRRQKTKTKRTR